MCPDQQILSIYMDEELPSPWKEKFEKHLTECSACKKKLESYRQFRELLKINSKEKQLIAPNQPEQELIEEAKDRVWQELSSRKPIKFNTRLLQRRLSIPLPAAAAAAVLIIFMTMIWFNGRSNNSGLANQQTGYDNTGFFLAAQEEIPGTMAMDLNSVLQYLTSDSTDIIILTLPENRNFYRTGEPGIIRAADYARNDVHGNNIQRNETLWNDVPRNEVQRNETLRNDNQRNEVPRRRP